MGLGEKKTLWATQLMSSLRRALRAAVWAGGNPDERHAVGHATPDMPRTKTWELDLGRAFPRDEPLAGLMARLVLHPDRSDHRKTSPGIAVRSTAVDGAPKRFVSLKLSEKDRAELRRRQLE